MRWITHPFPNFNGVAFEVWEWISNFTPHFIMGECTYTLKLIHVSKRGHSTTQNWSDKDSVFAWWLHDTETFLHCWFLMTGILRSPIDLPHWGLLMWSFDVFFVDNPIKLLNKQPFGQWFETFLMLLRWNVLRNFGFHGIVSWNLTSCEVDIYVAYGVSRPQLVKEMSKRSIQESSNEMTCIFTRYGHTHVLQSTGRPGYYRAYANLLVNMWKLGYQSALPDTSVRNSTRNHRDSQISMLKYISVDIDFQTWPPATSGEMYVG